MNFFKKISSKRISTAPDDCNNRKFKSKYAEHNPLPPSPPLLSKAAFLKQDNSLLELNIPDDLSSFDIPQLQSIHKRSVDIDRSKTDNTASIRIVKATHIVQNITAVDNTTTVCLEPFSKTETEQGTRMHTELNDPTATSVHATIPENHSELALEFTDNEINSSPYSKTQEEEGEYEGSTLLNGSTEPVEPDSIELNNETDTVSIDSSIISNTLSCTNNLNTSNTDLSPGKEIENAPILSIETVQVVLEEDKEGTDLSSADSRSLHQSSSISKEITKSISSRCNSNNTSAIIETAAEQYHGQEPPALLQTRSISEDNTTENIIESEEAVNLLAVTSSLDDETIDNNIVSTENDICLPKNNTSTDANHQTNSNATSIAAKRRSVYSLIPLKQQQAVTEEPPLTTSKIPVVQINNTRQQQGTGNSRGIPLPSRLSTTIIPPAIIQETLTAISSPSSSSGSLGKSMRSMSSVSTSSRSSNNSQHSQQQQQQQRKGTGGRSPVHNYRPLIQPQSKIPIAATVNPAAEIAKLAETVIPVSHHHISRLPKRNSTIM